MKTILTYIRPKMGQMSVQLFIKFAGTIVELLLPWMLSVIWIHMRQQEIGR